jgi:CDP-diacylglycerol--glycerol-3-phosphate 3-phosphatidyltransferase
VKSDAGSRGEEPGSRLTLANAITTSRLGLLVVIVVLLYSGRPNLVWFALALTVLNIGLDGIDGIVARRRGEATQLGSVLDIAIDRVVENVYWISFVGLRLIPVWVALIVVGRGILTDAVRGYVLSHGETAFEMMHSRIGRAIVASRFMRGFYGFAKVTAFAALIALHALQLSWTGAAAQRWLPRLDILVFAWVLLTISITLVRGVPVLVEARRYL